MWLGRGVSTNGDDMPKAKPPTGTNAHEDPAPAAAPETWLRRRGWVILLAAILVVAAGVRLYGLTNNSLWGDELWTVSVSVGRSINGGLPTDALIEPPVARVTRLEGATPIWRLWSDSQWDIITQPPLYFILLRGWREVFGESDAAMRMLSVAFSLVAILLLFDVGRLLGGRAAGLWAAAIMALAVPQVGYAQEVRNYTIQLVFALAAAGVLLRIERDGTTWQRLTGLTLCALALVLSHYFALGAVLALGAYAMLRLGGPARWRVLASLLTAAILFTALWGRVMWRQRAKFGVGSHENSWLHDPEPGRWLRAIGDALAVPAKLLAPVGEHAPSFAILGAFLLMAGILLFRQRPEIQLPLAWICGTIGLILLMDTSRSSLHLLFGRYTLIAGPGVYLLLALLVDHRVYRHILPAAGLAFCMWGLPSVYANTHESWRSGNDSWRAPAAWVTQRASPEDLLFFSCEGGSSFDAHIGLLGFSHYAGDLPNPVVVAVRTPDEALLAQVRRRGGRIWLINTNPRPANPFNVLPGLQIRGLEVFHPTAAIWEGTLGAAAAPEPL